MCTSAQVAELFVQKYYEVIERAPLLVALFYKENSVLNFRDVGCDGQLRASVAKGNEAINETIQTTVANCALVPGYAVDAQPCVVRIGDPLSVLLVVSGNMRTVQGVERPFSQTFFLAPQEKGFYVLNDILRLFPPQPSVPEPQQAYENGYMPHPSHPVQSAVEAAPPPALQTTAESTAANSLVESSDADFYDRSNEYGYAEVVDEQPEHAHAVAPHAHDSVPLESLPQSLPAAQDCAPPAGAPMSWADRAKLQKGKAALLPQKGPMGKSTPPPAPASPPMAAPEPAPVDLTAQPAMALDSAADVLDAQPTTSAPSAAGSLPRCFGLFLRDIPQPSQDVTPEQIKARITEEFRKFGSIVHDTPGRQGVQVVNKPKGWVAYVRYQDVAASRAALEQNRKVVMDGRPISIAEEYRDSSRMRVFAPDAGRGRGHYDGGRGRGRGGEGRGMEGRGGEARGGAFFAPRMTRPDSGRGGRSGGRGGRSDGGRGPLPAAPASPAPQ